jgi:hypothetical protein
MRVKWISRISRSDKQIAVKTGVKTEYDIVPKAGEDLAVGLVVSRAGGSL